MKQLHTHTNESQDGKMAQIVLNTCIFSMKLSMKNFIKFIPYSLLLNELLEYNSKKVSSVHKIIAGFKEMA